MVTQIVVRNLDGFSVSQRQTDGYVNATELCKAAGKLFADYRRGDAASAYLDKLSATMGYPIVELVQSRPGRPDNGGGTWVHPKVAINLAQWLSPDFSVQVTEWVFEILKGGSPTLNPVVVPATPPAVPMRFSDDDEGDREMEAIAAAFAGIAENRRRTRALAREVDDVRVVAEDAHRVAEAAFRTTTNDTGYVALQGFCNLTGRKIPVDLLQVYGRRLSAICRQRDIRIGRTGNTLWGAVNTYPTDVIAEFFAELDAAEGRAIAAKPPQIGA